MCAIAENVVPRSMPTALRVVVIVDYEWVEPEATASGAGVAAAGGGGVGRTGFPASRHDFLGADGALAPGETGLDGAGDEAVVVRGDGGLERDGAMGLFIDGRARGRAGKHHVHAQKHLDHVVKLIFDVAREVLQEGFLILAGVRGGLAFLVVALGGFVGRRHRAELFQAGEHLFVDGGEVVEERDEVTDERLLERVEEEIVLVAFKFGVQGVESFWLALSTEPMRWSCWEMFSMAGVGRGGRGALAKRGEGRRHLGVLAFDRLHLEARGRSIWPRASSRSLRSMRTAPDALASAWVARFFISPAKSKSSKCERSGSGMADLL